MMRARAIVAYDGTNYAGFQRQSNAATIQAELESALFKVTGERTKLIASGRTDAGVHARGQVIAFNTSWRHTLDDLLRALNAVLPADIAVQQIEGARPDYHPRYEARSRWYRYTLCAAPVRRPLARLYSLHLKGPVDVPTMTEASECLLGEHDFAAFGQPPSGRTTVRRVHRAEWREDSPWITFDIEANAFLYRMVRSIVGTLLEVGRGAMSVGEFQSLLASGDRARAGPTVPPHGLCLMAVTH